MLQAFRARMSPQPNILAYAFLELTYTVSRAIGYQFDSIS